MRRCQRLGTKLPPRRFFSSQVEGSARAAVQVGTQAAKSTTTGRNWRFYPRGRGGLVLGALGLGAFYLASTSKTWERPMTFWKGMFPIYLHYRYVQWSNSGKVSELELDKLYEELHHRYAPQVYQLILQLRGLYVKIGQVGITREDLLPPFYRDTLKPLLDRVPCLPGAEARKIVEDALGKPVDQVFSEFYDEAIGAASIGQVHFARLRSTGEEVAVKIKYPDAQATFRQDMATMRRFCELAQPENLPIMDELERQFLSEFDFLREAHALQEVRQNVMPKFSNVVIPRPVMELCNENIVVMEYLKGVKLLDAVMRDYERIAKKMSMSVDELGKRTLPGAKQRLTWSQYLVLATDSAVQQTFKTIQSAGVFTYNNTLGWFTKPLAYPTSVHRKEVMQTLLDVHAQEILLDGVFNGDPHPGNILLLEDGRIGLIDYGQVKRFTVQDRRNLAECFVALADYDRERTVELSHRLGFRTEKNDPDVLYETCQIAFNRDDPEALQGRSLQKAMEDLDRRDRTKGIPEQYVMAARTGMLLRGLARLLKQPPVKLAEEWKPVAEKCLRELQDHRSD